MAADETAARRARTEAEGSVLPSVHDILAPATLSTHVQIPVYKLAWDYSMTMRKISQLTDDHVTRVKAGLNATALVQPAHVKMLPPDAHGVFQLVLQNQLQNYPAFWSAHSNELSARTRARESASVIFFFVRKETGRNHRKFCMRMRAKFCAPLRRSWDVVVQRTVHDTALCGVACFSASASVGCGVVQAFVFPLPPDTPNAS